jgi:hypothetical protein
MFLEFLLARPAWSWFFFPDPMKRSPFAALFALPFLLGSASAGDSLYSADLGKAVLESNERLSRNWFLEVAGGPAFGLGGDLTRARYLDLCGCPTSLDGQSFNDLYGAAWLYGLRFGRQLGPNELYLRLVHTQADGENGRIGTRGGYLPLYADFGSYSDFGILFGVRREFMQPNRLHPYAGVEAGVRFVNDVDFELSSPGWGGLGRLPLYDDTAVFTAELTLGLAYDVTQAFRVGVETGLRYQGSLDQSDDILAHYGLDTFNTNESLLFVPLLVTGRVAF